MAKPYNRALYANINNKLVRLGDEPQACSECNVPFWEVAFCPHCDCHKQIRVCANVLYHTPQQPGFFLVRKPNQRFCSAKCELPPDGTYSVGVFINNVPIEIEFSRAHHTPRHLLDIMKGQASHGIVVPDPNAALIPETLLYPMDPETPSETNHAFVQRTAILLCENPATDKLSTIFKPPCSDMTVQDYIDHKPPPAFFDAQKDWLICMKNTPFDMDRLLWDQLDHNGHKWVNQEGQQLLLVEMVEREKVQEKPSEPSQKEDLSSGNQKEPSPKKKKKQRSSGEPKTREERELIAWFVNHGFRGMTMPRARDKKTPYIRLDRGIAVASVYGKTYYDAFLKVNLFLSRVGSSLLICGLPGFCYSKARHYLSVCGSTCLDLLFL